MESMEESKAALLPDRVGKNRPTFLCFIPITTF
jgi:hypothetical protein